MEVSGKQASRMTPVFGLQLEKIKWTFTEMWKTGGVRAQKCATKWGGPVLEPEMPFSHLDSDDE